MLTLYYAPRTRATRIAALLHELGAWDQVQIRPVSIRRADGTGAADPHNPSPEGKVPVLVHDGVEIWESTAIALHLTELFPDAGLGRPIGTPERGQMLGWLAWYGDVLEPVMVLSFAALSHPILHATFRGAPEVSARLVKALENSPYLVGKDYSVADLIVASAFQFAPQFTPDHPAVRDWLQRCADRPAQARAAEYDTALLQDAEAD